MQVKKIIEKINRMCLTPTDLAKLNDRQAVQLLEFLRWRQNGGKPFCPKCGNCETIYRIKSRNWYKCGISDCKKNFSVTNQTIFHNHSSKKESGGFALAVYAISLISLGLTIQEISNITGLNYTTVQTYYHKVLAMFEDYNKNGEKFRGVVEMDGAYFYRFNTKHRKEKRVAISLRERGERGSVRTRFFVAKTENAFFIDQIAQKYIEKGTEVQTDGHFAYTVLGNSYNHKTVNHHCEYVTKEGVNNNQCESINSEIRLAIDKERRGVKQTNFLKYLNFFAYNADMRTRYRKTKCVTKKEFVSIRIVELLILSLSHQVPNDLINYTRGNHPVGEQSGL